VVKDEDRSGKNYKIISEGGVSVESRGASKSGDSKGDKITRKRGTFYNCQSPKGVFGIKLHIRIWIKIISSRKGRASRGDHSRKKCFIVERNPGNLSPVKGRAQPKHNLMKPTHHTKKKNKNQKKNITKGGSKKENAGGG